MTEEGLMAAYCEGDENAFLRLLALLGPKLHGFFMRSFRDHAVADDLLQTTMLKLHRARRDYQRERPLRPWVFSIAARVRLDELRRRRVPLEDLDDEAMAVPDGSGGQIGAEDLLDHKNRATQVRSAIGGLPESQRVIVHLHRFEGLTFTEIAQILETTEGAVKLRAFRAYERLRKQLAPLALRERAS